MQCKLFAAAVTAMLALSGCTKTGAEPAGAPKEVLVQDKVCEVRDWQANASASCKPGQKIVFLPNSFGNEQLPILFVAVNCDMRYSVALTNGGVACIHAKLQTDDGNKDAAK